MTTFTPLTNRIDPTAYLGADITEADSLDEALHIAGLDWQAITVPADNLTILGEDGITSTSIPGRNLLMRSDNNVTLGVVGERYQPVSNATAFRMASEALNLGARFNSAGEYDHGRKSYLTLDLPDATVNVGGQDPVLFKIMLATTHDGSGSVTGSVRALRQVCTNGMTVALNTPANWTVKHTLSADNRIEQATHLMKMGVRYADEFQHHADELLATPMSVADFNRLVDTIIPPLGEDATKRAKTRRENQVTALNNLFNLASTQEFGRGTAWAGFNAFAEYADWVRPAKGGDRGRALRNLNATPGTTVTGRVWRILTHA